jgi:hypothetical protein
MGSLVRLPGWIVLSNVAWQSTLETRTKSLTSLRGCILLVRGCRMRDRWYILHGLLHNWMGCLLLRIGHWKTGTLHLKVGMLHQELGTLNLKLKTWVLHWCVTQKWGSNKLTRLRKAGPSVASGMLAQENHLALAILVPLF